MANKYDTNPLDPNFPRKAAHPAEGQQTETLPNLDAKTRNFNGGPYSTATEDPTRRYDHANFAQYSSVYADQPQGSPVMYQTTQLPGIEKPTDRKVSQVGLPENIMMVLPYAPFYIGLVAGVLELLFVPQSETKVRFHAAQGLATNIAILMVSFLLGFIAKFSSMASFGSFIFWGATLVGLIICMVRIWKGKVVHFEFLDSLTNWLSEKIKIQKQ